MAALTYRDDLDAAACLRKLMDNAEVRKMAETRLNTKTKRVGALVMWLGMTIVVLAALQFDRFADAFDAFARNPVERFFQIRSYHNGLARFTIWIGAILAVAGLLWSYLYDSTIGKVARWIETGSLGDKRLAQTIAAPRVEAKPAPIKSVAPSRPPSRAMSIAVLAAQSWLTIVGSTFWGFMFVAEGKSEALIWPAFIAAIFTVQSLIRMPSDSSGSAFWLIAGSKLIFAYLAFALSAIATLVHRIL